VAGPDGSVWFEETSRSSLARITPTGQVTEIPLPFGIGRFQFGPDGNIWAGTNTGVAEISPQGVVLRNYAIPSATSAPPFSGVRPTIGPDGNIWYTEPYEHDLIGRITPDGQITEFPIPGDAFGPAGAADLITGPDGNLWFDATGVYAVGRCTPNGSITVFSLPNFGSGNGVRGLTAGPDGNLWMAADDNQIYRVNTAGQLTGNFSIPTPNSGDYAMAAGSDGALWFTESSPSTNQIGRIQIDGTITDELPIPTSGPFPEAGTITEGSDGNIWFNEYSSNQIGEVVLHPRVNWINPAGGDWGNPANWQDDQGVHRLPGPNDQTIIDIPGQNSFTVTHSSSVADSVYSLTSQDAIVLSGGTLTINATSTINGSLRVTGATLDSPAALTVTGFFTLAQDGTLTGGGRLTASGGCDLRDGNPRLDNVTLNNATGSTLTLEGYLFAVHGAVLNNYGTFNNPEGDQLYGDGTGTINNYGLFEKAVRGTTAIPYAFSNYGTVDVQAGGLSLDNSTYNGGTFTGAAGTSLSLSGYSDIATARIEDAGAVALGPCVVTGTYSAGTTSVSRRTVALTGVVNSLGSVSVTSNFPDIPSLLDLTQATLTSGANTLGRLYLSYGSLHAASDFTVTGPFALDSGTLQSVGGGHTLTAAGGAEIGDGGSPDPTLLDGFTLINPAGQTLILEGYLRMAHSAVLTNYGTVNNPEGDQLYSDGTGTINSYGLFEKFGGGTTAMPFAFNNYGAADVQGGGLSLDGPTYNGGAMTGAAGTSLGLGSYTDISTASIQEAGGVGFGPSSVVTGTYSAGSTTLSGGTVALTGTVNSLGDVTIQRGATLDLTGARLAAGATTLPSLSLGLATLSAGTTVEGGTLLDHAALTVTGTLTLALDGVLTGGGSVTVQGGADVRDSNPTLDGFTLNNAAGSTLIFVGYLRDLHGAVINNYGTVSDQDSDAITGDLTGALNNYGLYVKSRGDDLVRIPFNNYGTFDDQVDDVFGDHAYCPLFTNVGLFVKSGGTGTTHFQMQLNNSGTVEVEQGILDFDCGYVQGSGGSISGSVSGDVSNPGQITVAPSPAPPVLTSYTQTATGTLNEQIGGLTAGTQYGQIIVNGNVNLAGSLQVVLISGFVPTNLNQFTIIDNRGSNPVNGTFTNLPEGATVWDSTHTYRFTISYVGGTGNDVVLTARQTATTTAVTTSASSPVLNQNVTFTATITPASGGGTPSGSVQFQVDGASAGGPVNLSGGQASFSTATLSVGPHTIAAIYSGDGNFLSSTSSLILSVLSAQGQNALIVNQVNALVSAGTLSSGNGNALTTKLNSATASFNAGNTTAGVNQLNAFINQVNAFRQSGRLTAAQAQALISAANLAINAVGGSGAHLLADTGSGSSGSGDTQPVRNAGQLVTDILGVYLDGPAGAITPAEQARFDDAIATLDATFGPYGVDVVDVGTAGAADAVVQVELAATSAAGGAANGVLGCTVAGQITLVTGWDWYTGADPGAVGANQYDFQTIVTHELGHALGLGHSGDTASVMYAYLAPGTARRSVTTQDLSVLDSGGGGAEPLMAAPWHDRQLPVQGLPSSVDAPGTVRRTAAIAALNPGHDGGGPGTPAQQAPPTTQVRTVSPARDLLFAMLAADGLPGAGAITFARSTGSEVSGPVFADSGQSTPRQTIAPADSAPSGDSRAEESGPGFPAPGVDPGATSSFTGADLPWASLRDPADSPGSAALPSRGDPSPSPTQERDLVGEALWRRLRDFVFIADQESAASEPVGSLVEAAAAVGLVSVLRDYRATPTGGGIPEQAHRRRAGNPPSPIPPRGGRW
jgi:virginiamycin B lyase